MLRVQKPTVAPFIVLCCLIALASRHGFAAEPQQWSGIYPHLAYFNNEGECGTGAVVPWAGRLWVVTYAPHAPKGSSDKLYEISPELELTVRPESIGGTPANRMIHKESEQLFIGPYAIDAKANVRAIPFSKMFGRPTGNARHLTDPANKIYYASMEEALYEVDVHTLEVTPLYYDEADGDKKPKSGLPGYHGKGLYSGQGRVVYANNGEHGGAAQRNPFVESGVLAEWDGKDWNVVLRNQFTEVTGPGGIYGNEHPETDPLWCVGWDAKSLLLMVLHEGKWHRYRLPKASHSYDGAHGWNTEWPRIRDIGEDDLLMTMHGMFWRFPKTFTPKNSAGIAPRSTYLKVVGDFCRWQDRVVLGCDDTAKNEFLNKRRAKGEIDGPQSQSNLWFLEPSQLDALGSVIGRGAVWLSEDVAADMPSDPFLLSGFEIRGVHLQHESADAVTFTFEVDEKGTGDWSELQSVTLEPGKHHWLEIPQDNKSVWIRVRTDKPAKRATAWFNYRNSESRPDATPAMFDGLAKVGDKAVTGGLIRARGGNTRTLHFASAQPTGDGENGKTAKVGVYELTADMQLVHRDDPQQFDWIEEHAAIPSRKGVIELDAASVVYIDDAGKRFRLPRTNPAYDQAGPLGWGRLDREVATERDLFHCHGTFFELPAENAAGFGRVRPVCSHDLEIKDYCSYRGLFVMSGVNLATAGDNRHILRSDDGKTALWIGAIDDIWQLGKPVGYGGPWKETEVAAGKPSDPYLMTGYDQKTLTLDSDTATQVSVELDITGTGQWVTWKTFDVAAGQTLEETFPTSLQAYWLRCTSSKAATVTAQLKYE